MSIKKIIDWSILQAEGEKVGMIASPFYQFYADGKSWMWACDVDIGEEEVLRNVPVACNNREIIYAEQGKSVALRRMNNGKLCIAGLAKTSRGLGHVIYVKFEEDTYQIVGSAWTGKIVRPLTYGELGSLGPAGGYGALPYGAQGRFTPAGALIEILEN
ncbi:MAG: hypothetical protein C4567_13140 [Deltaproteobacteria bacterium]|nr:MAG: hypothetical protein C4567_13140 [Deltaproteobacteria bacterium]